MRIAKGLTTGVVAVLALSVGAFALQAGDKDKKKEPLSIGATIPSSVAKTKLKNVDGKAYTLAGAKGDKGTLVMFSCNACPWVKAWEERIVSLGNEFHAKGVGVIVINSNDPEQNKEDGYDVMQARAKQRGMKFPYVMDATSEVAVAFGATRTPEAFLFDAKGKLVYHGTIDDNAYKPNEVEETFLADALSAVVEGKEVPVATTKALGCGIKFRGKSTS